MEYKGLLIKNNNSSYENEISGIENKYNTKLEELTKPFNFHKESKNKLFSYFALKKQRLYCFFITLVIAFVLIMILLRSNKEIQQSIKKLPNNLSFFNKKNNNTVLDDEEGGAFDQVGGNRNNYLLVKKLNMEKKIKILELRLKKLNFTFIKQTEKQKELLESEQKLVKEEIVHPNSFHKKQYENKTINDLKYDTSLKVDKNFEKDFHLQALKLSRMGSVPQGPGLCFKLYGNLICPGNETNEKYERILKKNYIRKPDFYIIGDSFSGSTFFSTLLNTHEKILKPNYPKEMHYFDRVIRDKFIESFKNGLKVKDIINLKIRKEPTEIKSYFDYFPSVPKKNNGYYYVGYNPRIFYADTAYPLWMKAINPKMKMIVLLREPFKFISSAYTKAGAGKECYGNGRLRKGLCKSRRIGYMQENIASLLSKCPGINNTVENPMMYYSCDIGQYIPKTLTPDPYVIALYASAIKFWYQFFPKNQFLFIDSRDLFNNVNETMNRVAKFLKIDDIKTDWTVKAKFISHNKHKNHQTKPVNNKIRQEMNDFYKTSLEDLYNITGIKLNFANLKDHLPWD